MSRAEYSQKKRVQTAKTRVPSSNGNQQLRFKEILVTPENLFEIDRTEEAEVVE
jgi:hypothetical protein